MNSHSRGTFPASSHVLGITQSHLVCPCSSGLCPQFLLKLRWLVFFFWLEFPLGAWIFVPRARTVCSTSVTQVSIIIIYNFALLSNDVWRISWMNSDCNCRGYRALSANYWAQMIAFKYFSRRTWNKKQLAQLCQWISLLLPMGLRGRGSKKPLHQRR